MKLYFVLVTFALMFWGCTQSTSQSVFSKEGSPEKWIETCDRWDDWDKPGPPFLIHGTTYYLGTCGIAAILILGSDGHILIDGGTEAGAKLIASNIETLGVDLEDIEILLYSHEHFDHVGGLSDLQTRTGAKLLTIEAARRVFETGRDDPSDPQFGMHPPFPKSRVDGTVKDGEVIQLGDLALTAHFTPGHTKGALSWQWTSCEGQKCETIVYADSLSPISHDQYRFSDHLTYLRNYRNGLGKLSELDCTLLLTPHPSASQMVMRIETGKLIDETACSQYASAINVRLEKRLAKERKGD